MTKYIPPEGRVIKKMISQEVTKEFQEVLKEEYGRNVTLEEASIILTDLTAYFDTLSKANHRMQAKEENAIIIVPD